MTNRSVERATKRYRLALWRYEARRVLSKPVCAVFGHRWVNIGEGDWECRCEALCAGYGTEKPARREASAWRPNG